MVLRNQTGNAQKATVFQTGDFAQLVVDDWPQFFRVGVQWVAAYVKTNTFLFHPQQIHCFQLWNGRQLNLHRLRLLQAKIKQGKLLRGLLLRKATAQLQSLLVNRQILRTLAAQAIQRTGAD